MSYVRAKSLPDRAIKVHANALGHIRQGCLTRHLSGIPSDGSRIEGVHKDLSRVQKSVSSGLVMVIGLTYDFYHRRNMRNAHHPGKPTTAFISTTYGSHHIHLVNAIARLWEAAINRPRVRLMQQDLPLRPTLALVESGEMFGLVDSVEELALGGAISIKEGDGSDEGLLTEYDTATTDKMEVPDLFAGLGLEIQPIQFLRPLRQEGKRATAPLIVRSF
jgi:hypothetical protein